MVYYSNEYVKKIWYTYSLKTIQFLNSDRKDLCQGLLCGIEMASGVFSAWTFGNFPVIHSFIKNSLYFSVSSKQICRTLFETLAHWSKSVKTSSFTLSQKYIWRFHVTYSLLMSLAAYRFGHIEFWIFVLIFSTVPAFVFYGKKLAKFVLSFG